MDSKYYRWIELIVLFIAIPMSLLANYDIKAKLFISIIGFIYIVYILLKVEKNTFKIKSQLNWYAFWRETLLKFLVIVILTTVFVWFTNKALLFKVILHKPLLWSVIVLVYSLFSVYPQELMYRTFYFQRYNALFSNKTILIFSNALVFALGHLFFQNELVIIFTFIGGLLFAFTYKKTDSTFLVSIEHAIYGVWLFTIGMGEMLGFPS